MQTSYLDEHLVHARIVRPPLEVVGPVALVVAARYHPRSVDRTTRNVSSPPDALVAGLVARNEQQHAHEAGAIFDGILDHWCHCGTSMLVILLLLVLVSAQRKGCKRDLSGKRVGRAWQHCERERRPGERRGACQARSVMAQGHV